MIATYRIAWDAFLRMWQFIVFVCVLLVVADAVLLTSPGGSIGTELFVLGLTALYAHRVILTGGGLNFTGRHKAKRGQSIPIFAFMWRIFVLFALGALIGALAWIVIGNIAGDWANIGIVQYLTILVFYGLLARVGTILPATAIYGDKSLKAAIARARTTFWITYGRLIFGNLLFTLIAKAVLVLLAPLFVGPAAYAGDMLSELANFFAVLLTASAISLAYAPEIANQDDRFSSSN